MGLPMKLRDWINEYKLKWMGLSRNINASHMLENNLDKVSWYELSKNPAAIHLLENNLDKVLQSTLSLNSAAIHILKNNLDKVNWEWLSTNPNIFTYDYSKLKESKKDLHKELIEELYNPIRIEKWLNKNKEIEEYLQ